MALIESRNDATEFQEIWFYQNLAIERVGWVGGRAASSRASQPCRSKINCKGISSSLLVRVHWHVRYITVQGHLQLAEGLSLHLACILQFADPVCLLFFKAGDLHLNLNSFFVFLVNSSDQVESLLLSLQGLLLSAQFFLLLFLAPNHVFHSLSLQLVRLLLHRYHFVMLGPFLFKSNGLMRVTLLLVIAIKSYCCTLIIAIGGVTFSALPLFICSLICQHLLLVLVLLVSLAHLHDLDSLLFRLLDLLPCLQKQKAAQAQRLITIDIEEKNRLAKNSSASSKRFSWIS